MLFFVRVQNIQKNDRFYSQKVFNGRCIIPSTRKSGKDEMKVMVSCHYNNNSRCKEWNAHSFIVFSGFSSRKQKIILLCVQKIKKLDMYVIRTLDMYEHQNVGFKHTLSEKGYVH